MSFVRVNTGRVWCCILTGLLAISAVADTVEGSGLMTGIEMSGNDVRIAAGNYDVLGGPLNVTVTRKLRVLRSDTVTVVDEPLALGAVAPESYNQGTRLSGVRTRGVNAYQALDGASVEVRRQPRGELLERGKDFLVAPDFGMVGVGPDPSVRPEQLVYVSYSYSLRRIDAIHVDPSGVPELVHGQPHLTCPRAPVPAPGHRALANIYRPYRADSVQAEDVYPVMGAPEDAPTATTVSQIGKVREKVSRNEPVTIVCWGDSVTAGGDVSSANMKYVERFRRMLLDKYPFQARINIINVSYGGSNSMQWRHVPPYTEAWFAANKTWPVDQIDFQRVLELRPDVVTMEFVNDAGLDEAGVEANYLPVLEALRDIGAELVLITPHFTVPYMMGAESIRTGEIRPYVQGLYAFADKYGVALADASARWEHLVVEGIPYVTLLENTLNHPDDRGHRFFAEELTKCFR